MPLLLVVLWGVSMQVIQPLRALRADVSHVEATSTLPAGWSQSYPFAEYSALARSVQALVDRLQGQIRREKLFASDVAHELRTPLTTLALLSHQVAEGDMSQIKDIEREALRAGQILEQLLALARGEQAADVRLHKSCIDLPELAQTQTQSLMAQAQLCGHAMRCDISPQARDAQVHCDVTLLGLAVANLIRNAIVHTPSGTAIVVSVYRVGQETVLEVWDDPNELAANSTAHERLHDGLGLGLGLVERIMNKSKGRWVQDRPQESRQVRSRLIWKDNA
jgi:two-component system sensor histidine kinase QseC